MCDERLKEFSRQRLGGRPVPEDVRLLATAQWEGRGHPFEQFGIAILEPSAPHPLTDFSHLGEKERADPDIMGEAGRGAVFRGGVPSGRQAAASASVGGRRAARTAG